MTADIFGVRYYGRQPAWHALGTVSEDEVTAKEAFERGGLNYSLSLQPIVVKVATLFGNELVEVADKMMIVRDQTPDDPVYRTFGVVSPDYGLIQNMELAEILDQLTGDWPVETVGALAMGKRIFCTLDAGEFEVKGDPVHSYFLATNCSDGNTTLQVAFTPVRVVCQNTLVLGLREATVSASLAHHREVAKELDFRVKLVAQMQKAKATTAELFDRLATLALTKTSAAKIFEAAYPAPKKPRNVEAVEAIINENGEGFEPFIALAENDRLEWQTQVERSKVLVGIAGQLYERFNDEQPTVAKTGWAAWNAVVELSDYREGTRPGDASSLWGTRAQEKVRALKALQGMLK